MKISRLFIDTDLEKERNRDESLNREIDYLISKIGRTPEMVGDSREIYDLINAADDPVTVAKTILYITRNRGAVVRECPGTSIYTCCDYTILHTGTFCPCTYSTFLVPTLSGALATWHLIFGATCAFS